MNKSLVAVGLALAASPVFAQNDLIAIDVLLLPDETMMAEASEWNARMRELTPEGFDLDASHQPHVTLLQRHVARADLDELLAKVAELRNNHDLAGLTMVANGLYHIPTGDQGLAGITVEPSGELLELQRAVIDAVQPHDAGPADASAYAPDPTNTPFDDFLFQYVETFVPEQTGENFNPHVTIGLAPKSWLEEAEAAPFDRFTFGAADLAVYQLGNFGTAAVRLDQ